MTNADKRIEAELDRRLERLIREVNDQEHLIYSGEGVPATRALDFLRRVRTLADACAMATSTCLVEDVIESLTEAAW